MTDDEKDVVDLHPSEWTAEPKGRESVFGQNWWVLVAIPALIAFLTFFGGPDSPAWVRAIALALR